MKFVRLTTSSLKHWQRPLEEFESVFRYPLGTDEFSISHGKDYLAFVKRIGSHTTYCSHIDHKIIAVGGGTISRRHKAWYLCDMKVHPDHRGKKIPRKLFTRYFLPNYLRCRRGYALNMESSDGKENPIRKIMENLPWTPLKTGARIHFYYEDEIAASVALRILNRPNSHFSSLAGKKDLVLKSSGTPIPLLHLEWGEKAEDFHSHSPQKGKLHMWCLPASDQRVPQLERAGILPKASGLIYHHGMNGFDWSDLRTSEL